MTVGQHFQTTDSRPFTADGVRAIHTRVTEWEVTEADADFLSAEAVGVISEHNRPPFAGYPLTLTMLTSSYARRISTGEIVEVTA